MNFIVARDNDDKVAQSEYLHTYSNCLKQNYSTKAFDEILVLVNEEMKVTNISNPCNIL